MVVLVTGSTGTQGSAVVDRLAAANFRVRALVRDLHGAASQTLLKQGAELIEGTFEDPATLDAALDGAQAVFSVQPAPFSDPDSERRQVRVLVDAARRAGVGHFIHSSVSNTGGFQTMEGWQEGRWSRNYWQSKADAEANVREAGFTAWTILRPAFMMENFAPPKSAWMFPDLSRGEIRTAVAPETRIALVAAADIGGAVVAALHDPGRFSGQAVELAGDRLTMPEIARVLGDAHGHSIVARFEQAATLMDEGQGVGWVETQQWLNVVGYPARPAQMEAFGLMPTRFKQWARSEAAKDTTPA